MTARPSNPKLSGAARLVRAVIDSAGAVHKTIGSGRPAAPVALAPAHAPFTIFINIRRPLMSVWSAALLLDRDEEFVERLFQDGKLAWVFNIATPGARNHCSRIFTPCVLDFRAGAQRDFSAPFVLNAIFPESRSRFRLHEVAYAWHCGAEQVRMLVQLGALTKIPGTGTRGPANGAMISRAVLANFLTSRRIT
jgi:hypothetical protein